MCTDGHELGKCCAVHGSRHGQFTDHEPSQTLGAKETSSIYEVRNGVQYTPPPHHSQHLSVCAKVVLASLFMYLTFP